MTECQQLDRDKIEAIHITVQYLLDRRSLAEIVTSDSSAILFQFDRWKISVDIDARVTSGNMAS